MKPDLVSLTLFRGVVVLVQASAYIPYPFSLPLFYFALQVPSTTIHKHNRPNSESSLS